MGPIFLVFFSFFSSAQQCLDIFSASEEISIERSQVRPLTFSKVEVHRRNNNIGVQQYGDMRLEKWFELAPYSEEAYNFVGLTPEGRVYQVVDWHGQRRIARLLSGEKQFEDIYLIDGKALAATDRAGQVYLYSPKRWAQSPRGEAIKMGAMIWSGVTFITTAGIYLLVPDAINWNIYSVPLPATFVGVVSALQTGFVMLNRFDHKNTYPDGFLKTDLNISSSVDLESAFSMLSVDVVKHLVERTDFALPERSALPPTQPEETTEGIR